MSPNYIHIQKTCHKQKQISIYIYIYTIIVFILCHGAHPSSVFVFLPPGCGNLPWPLCASDSLHLNLLPQFNRQHKGRKEEGRELQSVS